jgi:hypothetical protein
MCAAPGLYCQVACDPEPRIDLESAVAALEGLEAALWPRPSTGSGSVGCTTWLACVLVSVCFIGRGGWGDKDISVRQ